MLNIWYAYSMRNRILHHLHCISKSSSGMCEDILSGESRLKIKCYVNLIPSAMLWCRVFRSNRWFFYLTSTRHGGWWEKISLSIDNGIRSTIHQCAIFHMISWTFCDAIVLNAFSNSLHWEWLSASSHVQYEHSQISQLFMTAKSIKLSNMTASDISFVIKVPVVCS